MSARATKEDIKTLKGDIKKLPKSFTSNEIVRMYAELKKDMADLSSRRMSPQAIEKVLHSKHKTLALAYPTIYFKTVRGEMDPKLFFYMMKLKKDVDSGDITNEEAKNSVIDGVKKRIEERGATPKQPYVEGRSVTEFTAVVKSDD